MAFCVASQIRPMVSSAMMSVGGRASSGEDAAESLCLSMKLV